MGLADDIMQEFLAAHPDAARQHSTLEELNQKLNAFMQNRNRQPLAAFDGLSAEQMHILLKDPMGDACIIRRLPVPDRAVLDQIPFFCLMEILYGILSKNPLKLTPKGNLPLWVCNELYEQKLLAQDDVEKGYTKKVSEDNVGFIRALKACILISPDVKKRGNTLSFTHSGRKWSSKERHARFWQLFDIYTTRFNWGYLDYAGTQAGHFGWAYSLYLLDRYGTQQRKAGFYASKVLLAFPDLHEPDMSSGLSGFAPKPERIYQRRFAEQFASWFGLIELCQDPKNAFEGGQLSLRKSPIFHQLFQVNAPTSPVNNALNHPQ